MSSTDRVRVFESPGTHLEKIFFESDFTTKIANFLSLSNIFLDSFQTPQTRESVESSKNRFEYESFEYESRLDPSLEFSIVVAVMSQEKVILILHNFSSFRLQKSGKKIL